MTGSDAERPTDLTSSETGVPADAATIDAAATDDVTDPHPGRTSAEVGLTTLLEHLTEARGFEAASYQLPTLQRRIDRRLVATGAPDYLAYRDRLEADPDEYARLFDTVLINVTDFLRDRDAWEMLREEVVPRLVTEVGPDGPLRIWSAACSTGEEAYSLAMVLADVLGPEAFRQRVTVYGTDVDDDAIEFARQARFPRGQVEQLPDELAGRYFAEVDDPRGDPADGTLTFREDLRRNVVFGRHDLLRDAPISRLDLLSCRNALMYFNTEAQPQVIDRFHFALRPGGVLFLGRAERHLRDATVFAPIDTRHRLYRKTGDPGGLRPARAEERRPAGTIAGSLATNVALRDATLDAGTDPCLCLDGEQRLALANAAARRLFRLEGRDLGRPFRDLRVSYQPVELRGLLDEATREGRPVHRPGVRWNDAPGEARHVDVTVTPLRQQGTTIGHLITFVDVTRVQELQRQLTDADRRSAELHRDLQASTEELETTNEELETTNEELRTTNEELQSTNEELHAINAELHAANQELHLAKSELQGRGQEREEVTDHLAAVLHGLPTALVVLDLDLRVRMWNAQAEDLWGLRAEEVDGKELTSLDIGLPTTDLADHLSAALAPDGRTGQVRLRAHNRRGMDAEVRVTITPTRGPEGAPLGVSLLMEEHRL